MLKRLLTFLGFIAVFIGVLVFVGVGGRIGGQTGTQVGKAVFSPSKPSTEEVEAMLETKLIEGFTAAANQNNQRLPMMLDQDTRLDKATVGPGPRSVLHHTYLRYTSRNIDANWLQENLRPEVVRKVCASADMKKPLQYGGIFVYAYSGSDGIEIIRFEIDRNDCGYPKFSP